MWGGCRGNVRAMQRARRFGRPPRRSTPKVGAEGPQEGSMVETQDDPWKDVTPAQIEKSRAFFEKVARLAWSYSCSILLGCPQRPTQEAKSGTGAFVLFGGEYFVVTAYHIVARYGEMLKETGHVHFSDRRSDGQSSMPASLCRYTSGLGRHRRCSARSSCSRTPSVRRHGRLAARVSRGWSANSVLWLRKDQPLGPRAGDDRIDGSAIDRGSPQFNTRALFRPHRASQVPLGWRMPP